MKNVKRTCFPIVLIVVAVLSLPALCFSADDANAEYASVIAQNGPTALIQPGHYSIIANYADNYFSQLDVNQTHLVPYHTQIFSNLVATNTLNNFFIVDVRECVDFSMGHLPNAVNIPIRTIAKPWNLGRLPTDKPILVVCYTGQGAGQATSFLNSLGYDAYNLKFGMLSVREYTMVKYGNPENTAQMIYGYNYPLEKNDAAAFCQ
jgi:rhodanese-related sulfurtransferase